MSSARCTLHRRRSTLAVADIDEVLEAIGDLQQLQHANAAAARLGLDDLLRYEENAYSNLRGWP